MRYNNFIRRGIEYQEDSVTKAEATRNFEISCRMCKGLCVECDQCPIAKAHEMKLQLFLDIEIAENQKKLQREKDKEFVKGLVNSAQNLYININCVQDMSRSGSELEKLADRFLQKFDTKFWEEN